jgi:ketosteroid isomerase-like protein
VSAADAEVIREFGDRLVASIVAGRPADLGDLSLLDAEVVYEDAILPDHAGEPYRGHDGFRRAWMRAIEPWEFLDARLEWVRDAGDGLVVSCHWGRMRGRGSGAEAEIRYAYVWRFRDGRVVHSKSYPDPAQALAVAGLTGSG